MPVISIERRSEWGEVHGGHLLPQGLLADTPDVDGVYPTSIEDQTITIEMHPPEVGDDVIAVALTCGLFVGHARSHNGQGGNDRRVVHINMRTGLGATRLSSFDKLVVQLQKK